MIVFIFYWFLTNKNIKIQNLFLLIANYFFYAWWDWRFLSLIFFISITNYFIGIRLSKTINPKHRKLLLIISIISCLGCLGFFKYYNFFTNNLVCALSLLDISSKPLSLNIILPIGISFYTFQSMSYSIDSYNHRLEPTKDLIAFLSFSSFFPLLLAGPIERGTTLLPQFFKQRQFDYDKAADGMRQILWGLFKKIVIADNCFIFVNEVFNNYGNYKGSTLLLGAILFTIQIYADFSGYSDMAIGSARLLGFNLMRNFNFPYFSKDIAEFWRKWHISLTSWFRDYVYIPLGGNRNGNLSKIRNILIVFLVSGFWHGANWTFIAWGFIHGCLYLFSMLLIKNTKTYNNISEKQLLPSLKDFFKISLTFTLVVFAWVFFRATNINHAIHYLSGIFSKSLFSYPQNMPQTTIIVIVIYFIVEWLQRDKQHAFQIDKIIPYRPLRWSVYMIVIFGIYYLGVFQNYSFIYFKF